MREAASHQAAPRWLRGLDSRVQLDLENTKHGVFAEEDGTSFVSDVERLYSFD